MKIIHSKSIRCLALRACLKNGERTPLACCGRRHADHRNAEMPPKRAASSGISGAPQASRRDAAKGTRDACAPLLNGFFKHSPRTSPLACLFLAGLLSACSSVKKDVNTAPVSARTFSFMNGGARAIPSYADQREQAHALVQQAIIRNLAARGVSYTPSGGNVTVAYLIVVGNNVATTALNEYFGYTEDSAALLKTVHSEQTGGDNRAYFESGTLVIDFVDPASSKLLQRRSIHAKVLRNLPLETRAERVQAIVDQALKGVPVS